MKRYCGRDFSADELLAITRLIEHNPASHRADLSRRVCAMFNWLKPDGGLKDTKNFCPGTRMTCRVAMLRMQDDGLFTLPASRIRRPRRRPEFIATPATDAQTPLLLPVHELAPLSLRQVAGAVNSRLWNEYIARYHYLGYTPMAGSQLRYFVFEGDRLLALLSPSTGSGEPSAQAPGNSLPEIVLLVGMTRHAKRICSSSSTMPAS